MSFLSRRHDGWTRFFSRNNQLKRRLNFRLLSSDEFLHAIEKEKARAIRRDLTFCVVRIDFVGEQARFPGQHFDRLLIALRNRLRITDELGTFQSTLGILLPETLAGDAALVSNELDQIAKSLGHSVSSDIFVWPVIEDGLPANRSEIEKDSISFELLIDRGANVVDTPTESDGNTAIVTQTQQLVANAPRRAIRVQPLDLTVRTPRWKRAIDISGSIAGLIVMSPVMIAVAAIIKCTSPGPILFSQWREGKDGKLFRIYKFRTMKVGADEHKILIRKYSEQDGPAFKIKNDPRLTRFGVYLRTTCIDELPQLINVLKGEMSLVGPRPLPADESLDCNSWQRRRLAVLPGMTCTWQVSGGRNIPFEEWMRMDLRYIRQCNLWSDTILLVKTFLVTILHRGSV